MRSILSKPLTPTTRLLRVLLLIFIAIPTTLILIPLFALLIPAYPILMVIAFIKRRGFIRSLRNQNRIIDLQTASSRVQSANGTLLVELHEQGIGDTWWIEADFSGEDCPLPQGSGLSNLKDHRDVWDTVFSNETYNWIMERISTQPAILFVRTPRHFWKTPHPEITASRIRMIPHRPKIFLNVTT